MSSLFMLSFLSCFMCMSCPGRFVSCFLSLLGSWLLATFNACILSFREMGFQGREKAHQRRAVLRDLWCVVYQRTDESAKSEYRIKPKKKNKKKSTVNYALIFGQYQDIADSI